MSPRRGLSADDEGNARPGLSHPSGSVDWRRRLVTGEPAGERPMTRAAQNRPAAGPARASRRAAPDDETDLEPPVARRPTRAAVADDDFDDQVAHRPMTAPQTSPVPRALMGAPPPRPGKSGRSQPVAGTRSEATAARAKPARDLRALARMRRERRLQLAGALTVALGIVATFAVGIFLRAEAGPVPRTVPLVTALSQTCPVSGAAAGTLLVNSSAGDIRLRTVGTTEVSQVAAPLEKPSEPSPLVVSPTQPQATVTGGNMVRSNGRLWWGGCRAAVADQYVQVPGGNRAKLIVINSEPEPALIDITITGPDGEIAAERLRGVTLTANSQFVLDLSEYSSDTNALGIRVRSSLGRVLALGEVNADAGADFVASTSQGNHTLIGAIPADPRNERLVITNPGTGRNVIQIEAITEAGRFVLPGFESRALNAQATESIDLTEALGGLPAGLVITSRDPVAATMVIEAHQDLGFAPGQLLNTLVAGQALISVVPDSGVLQVTNPSNTDALVVVDWGEGQAPTTDSVQAGTVGMFNVPGGARLAQIKATSPVVAALLLAEPDASGFAVEHIYPSGRAKANMPMDFDFGLGR